MNAIERFDEVVRTCFFLPEPGVDVESAMVLVDLWEQLVQGDL